MSDIRFNRWLHQSGTGGVYQDSTGRVGIGTSVPTSALDVQSGTIKIGNNTLSSSGVSTFTSVTSTTLNTTTLNVGTGGTIVTTTVGGLVGIGTTNPSSILDVRQTQVGNPSINLTNSSTDAGSYASYYINAGNVTGQLYCDAQGNAGLQGLTIRTTTNHGLRLGTNNIERLKIDSSGDLQLSTANTSILNSSGRKILNQTGGVLQVVNTIKTNQFTTTSGSPVDVTGLSASITPSSTSSKVLVIAWVVISTSGGGGDGFARLVRDSTAIGNGDGGYFGQSAGQDYFAGHSKPITYLDSPATTSSTTYKIQVWGANTSYVNGRGLDASFVTSSGITLMEISG